MSISLHRTFSVFSLCCDPRAQTICHQHSQVDQTPHRFPDKSFPDSCWQVDCRTVLTEIYGHLCISDMAVKTALIDTGPRPFCLQCSAPWGALRNASNAVSCGNLISDILIDTRVHLVAGNLTSAEWLAPGTTRGGLRHARR